MRRIPFAEFAPILANNVVPPSELSEQQQPKVPKKLIAAIALPLTQTIELGNLDMAYRLSEELEHCMACLRSSQRSETTKQSGTRGWVVLYRWYLSWRLNGFSKGCQANCLSFDI